MGVPCMSDWTVRALEQHDGVCVEVLESEEAEHGGVYGPLSTTMALAVTPKGNAVVFSCIANYSIRVMDMRTHATRTIAGCGIEGYRNGSAATARFNSPGGIAVTPDGERVIVGDTLNHCIRMVRMRDGTTSTLAGNGVCGNQNGSATLAKFRFPRGVAVTPCGTMVAVADSGNHCVRLVHLSDGTTTTLAQGGAPDIGPFL